MNNVNKKLEHYIELPYTITLRHDDEGDVIARIKELDGCVAHGQDELEALNHLHEAKVTWLTAALKAGREIPSPDNVEDTLPSGKFMTRVPRSLHKKLVDAAKFEGVSLNQILTVALTQYVTEKYSDLWRRHPQQAIGGNATSNGYARGSSVCLLKSSPTNDSKTVPLHEQAERDFFTALTEGDRLVGPRLVVSHEESSDGKEAAFG